MAGVPSAWKRLEAPLLFVAALLVIAALASNLANLAEPLPDIGIAPVEASPQGLLSPLVLLGLVWSFSLVALALLVGIFIWVRRRSGRLARTSDLLRMFVAMAILVALLLLWPLIVPAATQNATQDATNATAEPPSGSTVASPAQVLRGVPVLVVVFAILAFAFSLASMSRGFFGRRPAAEPEADAVAERRTAASAAIHRTIRDLEAGLDPREAILWCYAALSALLSRRGMKGMEPLTPREVERDAVAQFSLSRDDVGELTSVFEEARYSEHEMGPNARDRALLAFSHVRAALGA